MTNVEALRKVYAMALHCNDLKGQPSTDEEKEALAKAKSLIDTGAAGCPALADSQTHSNEAAKLKTHG